MPIFEGEDIPKMGELMNEELKQEFLKKRASIRECRQQEIDALEASLRAEAKDCSSCSKCKCKKAKDNGRSN